jgi:hypothetical protein
MDNKIQITPMGSELTIREGQALPVHHPSNLSIKGTIDAPSRFFAKKKDNYDWTRGHVIVNEMSLDLIWGEHENWGGLKVTGVLEEDPALKGFGINTHKKYHQKELSTLLKMNRIHFSDREDNRKIVSSIEKLKIKVTQEIENGNDFKGNKKQLFEQNVHHELLLHFTLMIPIFKGQPQKSFVVEINFDITDGNTLFWLESVDLKELMETERRAIMDEEVVKMDGLTIIYQ